MEITTAPSILLKTPVHLQIIEVLTLLPQIVDKLTLEGQVTNDNKLLELGIAGLTSLLANKSA